MKSTRTARRRAHEIVRAGVAATALAVAACFGAAISFAQTPTDSRAGSTLHEAP